ncbi:MAG: HD domain-containing protein [Clostridiales bacterium]|jgi:putative nucleotidyltransferase with HDIG domain|nr:HD domain-containing protein [Clostridiales bacterium]
MAMDLYAQMMNLPVGYIVLDTQFNIIYMNDYFRQSKSAYRANNFMAKKCYNICNGGFRCHECIVEKTMKSLSSERASRRVVQPDGCTFNTEVITLPFFDSKHRLQSVMEIVIDKTEEEEFQSSLEKTYLLLIGSITKLLEKKDKYTAYHSANVKHYSLYLAKYFNFSEADQKKILIAASLHDIGKVAIPDSILQKPGNLTDDEFEVLKKHPVRGAEIISKVKHFNDIADIIRYHHEKVDGTGYPYGLKGEDIPFMAKMVAVADSFDAMTTSRVYRGALDINYAVSEIKRNAGTQFDKDIAGAFAYLVENEVIQPIYIQN